MIPATIYLDIIRLMKNCSIKFNNITLFSSSHFDFYDEITDETVRITAVPRISASFNSNIHLSQDNLNCYIENFSNLTIESCLSGTHGIWKAKNGSIIYVENLLGISTVNLSKVILSNASIFVGVT